MDNSQAPQTPQPQAPQQPTGPAPQAPVDPQKLTRTGWIVFGISAAVTVIGLVVGFALAASALGFALAGRMGLQAKNKALAITSLVLCGLALALFILAYFTSK